MARLYVVPTPIGNLDDMTFRAVRILKEVDFVLAEDTRTSGFLLKHLGISKPMASFHKFNEHGAAQRISERIAGGESVALVSDAGMPGISDPGFLLVRECIRAGVEVEALPGATAFVPALIESGLPSDRFCFEGFLPQKKGRATRLAALAQETRTMIFYESPFRVVKTLEQLSAVMGPARPASVSRELTKKFAETRRGTLAQLAEHFREHGTKGEFVIVVGGEGCREAVLPESETMGSL